MFLNLTEVKKLMKHAYKNSGLVVGCQRGLIAANSAGTWGFRVDERHIPKKLKAAVVELIGDLPEEGEIYTYCWNGLRQVMEPGHFDFYAGWSAATDYAVQTPLLFQAPEGEYSFYQIRSNMGLCVLDQPLASLISPKDLDHGEEEMPDGYPGFDGDTLYWKNETMIYWAKTAKLNQNAEEQFLPRLNVWDYFQNKPLEKGEAVWESQS